LTTPVAHLRFAARDVRLAEMLIAKNISPSATQLEDPNTQLKSLLKG
jgi:hypothetical protein